MDIWAKLKNVIYKKKYIYIYIYQFKGQIVQNGLKGTKIDRVDQIGRNGTKVDLIGSNRNCLTFRKNKLSSKNFKEKNYTWYYNYKIIIYSHV